MGIAGAVVAARTPSCFPGKSTVWGANLAGELDCACINGFVERGSSRIVPCKPCFCHQSLTGCPISFPSEILIVLHYIYYA